MDMPLKEFTIRVQEGLDLICQEAKGSHRDWAEHVGAWFRLWSRGSRVLRDGRASLSHRLRLHQVASTMIWNLLDSLDTNIQIR